MAKNVRILSGGGINWTWYCHVEILPSGKARVLREYRLHNCDQDQGANEHPTKTDGTYRIIENSIENSKTKGRIAKGIEIHTWNASGATTTKFKLEKQVERFSLGD